MKWNHRNLYKELQEFSQENLNSYIWEECICIKKKSCEMDFYLSAYHHFRVKQFEKHKKKFLQEPTETSQ